MFETPLLSLKMHRPYGEPIAKAQLKSECADFQVREYLDFQPSAEGDHHFLYLEKRGVNTDFLVKQLQDELSLKEVDIGYAGRKDRHGVTAQWFSIHSPKEYDWPTRIDTINQRLQQLSQGKESVRLLDATKHKKKLRKGEIAKNHFTILLRELSPGRTEIEAGIVERIEQIRQHGFANYFGDQRLRAIRRIFSELERDSDRLMSKSLSLADIDTILDQHYARKLKRRRRGRKGFDLSVVRSFLFNLMLSDHLSRIENHRQVESDELDGSDTITDDLLPLLGQSRQHSWLESEFADTLQHFPSVMAMVEGQRIEVGWRSAWAQVEHWQHQWRDDTTLEVSFSLTKGCFATVLLTQLFALREGAE